MTSLRDRAWAAAAEVTDPEVPVLTIADLGVLRDVSETGDEVEVLITPTYSGCAAMGVIAMEVELALSRAGIPGRVRTVLSPAWTTDWMTQDGRRKLLAYGIAPPVPGRAAAAPCSAWTRSPVPAAARLIPRSSRSSALPRARRYGAA